MRISPCVFNTIFSKSWASITHYPVAEASLKKVIHDCFVEQDNPPPLKFRHPGLVVFAGTHSINYMTQSRRSSTFKGHLGHPSGTMSCHRGLGEQTCVPSSLARCRCCWKSCGKWLSSREKIFQANQFPSYPGDSLWVFRETWKNTQEQVLALGTACGNAVLSTAQVLNSSLSQHSDLSISFRGNLRGQNTCLKAQKNPNKTKPNCISVKQNPGT